MVYLAIAIAGFIIIALASVLGTAHRLQEDWMKMPWTEAETSASTNTTAGAGIIATPASRGGAVALVESNGSTAEIRTLPDPPKDNLILELTLFSQNGQNLVVRCSTPLWLGSSVTQPALTQNGQYLTFSAVGQVVFLKSVKCPIKQYTGSQANFTNVTGYRWVVMQADGVTLT